MSSSLGRRLAGGLIIVVMAASASYSANAWGLRDRYKPPAQRLVTGSQGAPAVAMPEANPSKVSEPTPLDRRSQPWWQQVGTFTGDGAFTSPPFEIASHALQWRVTYRCQGGPLRLVPLNAKGEEGRQLADVTTCSSEEGKGFSVRTGHFSLRIIGSGPWDVKVEQQVDVPMVEDLTPGMTSPDAKVIARYTFYNVDREGKGTARVLQLPDGSRVLRLEDFFVSINSDLEIWLSATPRPTSTAEVASAPHREVSFLKATTGFMNYPLPPDVDLNRLRSVVIWCEITHNAYAAAALTA